MCGGMLMAPLAESHNNQEQREHIQGVTSALHRCMDWTSGAAGVGRGTRQGGLGKRAGGTGA